MIPDDQVEEVRARADLVAIIGEHVDLKRAGKEYKACCPFHEEKTPSFYVVPDKGFYKCFGCGESGDVFTFLRKKLGLDFVDAVKYVAARCGVEIREVTRGGKEEDPNRPLYELLAFARDFYHQELLDQGKGQLARDYLEARGIDLETVERFGLGFAPDDWRAFRDAAAKHGYEDPLLFEAGLLAQSEKAKEPYDRFRARVIFPIEAIDGRVVAFGGRVLGKGEGGPKYLNSPETPIYHKGSVLYGLSWARHPIRRESAALVVEGYMDVVALAAGGFDNVVATLGTAMTPEHAQLLGRYTKRVYLLFDSDAAGLKATFRAGDTLLEQGVHPAAVTLPPGEDPDTLVRKEGAQGLRHYLDQAVDVLDRKIRILEERDFFGDIERTRRAVDRLLPTIRSTRDPTLRDIYVSKVAAKTGVRRETIEIELQRQQQSFTRGRSSARTVGGTSRPSAGGRKPTRTVPRIEGMGAERELLLLLLKDRDWIERASERLGPGEFQDSRLRLVYESLLDHPDLQTPPSDMDPAAAAKLEQLLGDTHELTGMADVFERSIARIKQVALADRSQTLREELADATAEDERVRILRELEELSRERRALGTDWSHAARSLHYERVAQTQTRPVDD